MPNDKENDDCDAMVKTDRRPTRKITVRAISGTCRYEKQSTKKRCAGMDKNNNDGVMPTRMNEVTKM